MPDGQRGTWLPLREAGPRLGVAPDSIRKRIRRGGWPAGECRRANDGTWQVWVPDTVPDVPPAVPDTPQDVPADVPDSQAGHARPDMPDVRDVALAALRERVTGLEAVVEAQRRHIATLEVELERRRWPGLRAWWRRLIEGEG